MLDTWLGFYLLFILISWSPLRVCEANKTKNKMAESLTSKEISVAEWEDKQLELEGVICRLTGKKLEELAEHLEIPIAKYTGKSLLTCVNVVRKAIAETVSNLVDTTYKLIVWPKNISIRPNKKICVSGYRPSLS